MVPQLNPQPSTQPLDILQRATLVGSATSVPGLVIGAVYGTLRTQTPILFALASGAQCFTIGLTFWSARTAILNQDGLLNWWRASRGLPVALRQDLNPSQSDKLRASTMSGAITGFSLGFLLRGPRNVIPGTIMFSLYGWAGQHGYNYLDARNSQGLQESVQMKAEGREKPKETLMQKFAKSKWSPMTVLTDDEYEAILEEKLLQIEAEIAVIDDKIEAVSKLAQGTKAQSNKEDEPENQPTPRP